MKNQVSLLVKILAVFFVFVFLGCSSSDSNPEKNEFLAIYNNTEWETLESGQKIYLKFYDNLVNPLDLWVEFPEGNCYVYQKSSDDGVVEVLDNTKSLLVIKITEDDDANQYALLIVTATNENDLVVILEEYENGELDGRVEYNLDESSINLDDLIICPFPV